MSDLSENLDYLVSLHSEKTRSDLASEMGISREALSRFTSGTRTPNRAHRLKIANWFKIADVATLSLPHQQFRAHYEKRSVSSSLRLLSLRTLANSREDLEKTAKKYNGQYKMYYRQPNAPPEAAIVVSFVAIEQATDEGIGVVIKNPYVENGVKSAFEYRGLLFPLDRFLYVITEQTSADYEIFSLILKSAMTPKVTTMKGMCTGIHVKEDVSAIGARPILLERRSKQFDNWQESYNPDEFGYFSEGKVPAVVKSLLIPQYINIV